MAIVVVSGSRSIKVLPSEAIKSLNKIMELGFEIRVGDAPGVDTLVQKHLSESKYKAVTVWYARSIRNCISNQFKLRRVEGNYNDRDREMHRGADYGLCIWDGKSRGTQENINRLPGAVKVIQVWDDAIAYLKSKGGLLIHQCNLAGGFGRGMAGQVALHYPIVRKHYKENWRRYELGEIQVVQVNQGRYICNMFGQKGYGRDRVYTDYEAVRKGLRNAAKYATTHKLQPIIPCGMGCQNAGGDWKIVQKIIEEEIEEAIIIKRY